MESSMKIWMRTGGYPMSLEWGQHGSTRRCNDGSPVPRSLPMHKTNMTWASNMRVWEYRNGASIIGASCEANWGRAISSLSDHGNGLIFSSININHMKITLSLGLQPWFCCGSSHVFWLLVTSNTERPFFPFRGWPRCWVHNSRSGCWPMAQKMVSENGYSLNGHFSQGKYGAFMTYMILFWFAMAFYMFFSDSPILGYHGVAYSQTKRPLLRPSLQVEFIPLGPEES